MPRLAPTGGVDGLEALVHTVMRSAVSMSWFSSPAHPLGLSRIPGERPITGLPRTFRDRLLHSRIDAKSKGGGRKDSVTDGPYSLFTYVLLSSYLCHPSLFGLGSFHLPSNHNIRLINPSVQSISNTQRDSIVLTSDELSTENVHRLYTSYFLIDQNDFSPVSALALPFRSALLTNRPSPVSTLNIVIDPEFLEQCLYMAATQGNTGAQTQSPVSPTSKRARYTANYAAAFTDTYGVVCGAPFIYKTGPAWPTLSLTSARCAP
jgi:hypothetical protein